MDLMQLLQMLRSRGQQQAPYPTQQQDGWSRIMPSQNGNDGQTRSLEELMNNSPRHMDYMNTYNHNSVDFRESGGRWDPNELDLRQREALINRLMQYYQGLKKPM